MRPQELMPRADRHVSENVFDYRHDIIRFSIGRDGHLFLTIDLPNLPDTYVTAHDAPTYERGGFIPSGSLQFIKKHKLTVLEVGAGINGFITEVHKPMIIDPLPYDAVDQALLEGFRYAPNPTSKQAIEILRRRIAFITNPQKAYLIPMTLEAAYESHRDLIKAWGPDIIVDINGAGIYGDQQKVFLYETDLLPDANPHRIWSNGQTVGGKFYNTSIENLGLV